VTISAAMSKSKPKKKGVTLTLLSTGKEYCENTSIHGFSYWTRASNLVERVFWVAIVTTGFAVSGIIVKTAVEVCLTIQIGV
jgi:hypothetical protein